MKDIIIDKDFILQKDIDKNAQEDQFIPKVKKSSIPKNNIISINTQNEIRVKFIKN